MALTLRGRRTRYDNIAVGSAAGRELTIAGDTVSKQEVYGGGYMVSTSNYEHAITNIRNEGQSGDATSTSDAGFQGPENGNVAENPADENVGVGG